MDRDKHNVIIMIPKRQFWSEFNLTGEFCTYKDSEKGSNCYKIIGSTKLGKHQFVCLTPWEETEDVSCA